MTDELQTIRKEAVVACSKRYRRIRLGVTEETRDITC
jgi:hypothetical protein